MVLLSTVTVCVVSSVVRSCSVLVSISVTSVVRIVSAVGCFEDCDSVCIVVAEENDAEGADDVAIDVTSNKDSLKILYIYVLVYTKAKYMYKC